MAKRTARQYAQALYELLTAPGAKTDAVIGSFVKTLKKNGALSLAPHIIRQFMALADAADGTVRATVTMTREPDATEDKALRAFIARKYHAERADVQYVTDPRIRGGFIARVGDEEYDASVTRRLQLLAQHLTR